MKLLLFSGGIDSTCLALIQQPDLLLSINYGQICAEGELRSAAHIAGELELPHEVISVSLEELGAGDLIGQAPSTFGDATENWPFRNQMLITLAAMKYAREGLNEILIGTVVSDAIHPDGRPEFIKGISHILITQQPSLRVVAPALEMTTEQLIDKSKISNELLGWTFSCHKANVACGTCRGCNKSLQLLEAMNHPQAIQPVN